MNLTFQNNNCNNIVTVINKKKRHIIINNVIYNIPKNIKGNNISQINDHIYIDGYEFKNGEFKKNFKSFILFIF